MTTQIECFKYNNSIEKEVQKQSCYAAFLSLSSDGTKFETTNRKPIPDYDIELPKENNFNFDANLNLETLEDKDDEDANYKTMPQGLMIQMDQEFEQIREEREMGPQIEKFDELPSSGSCAIDEIESFVYNGCSSRFWMLRKHINCMSRTKLDTLPFMSWNCITLRLGRRDVDLVLKNEAQMSILIKFLVYSLYTMDRKKNSAKPILDMINQGELEMFKQKTRQVVISKAQELKIISKNEE